MVAVITLSSSIHIVIDRLHHQSRGVAIGSEHHRRGWGAAQHFPGFDHAHIDRPGYIVIAAGESERDSVTLSR